ncbi:TcpE family conjugal transfer membrane protein [Nonomuraea sp. NPDC050310]|uniref:TcpE family conjugal transfer membrane protein n=1 Tax=Nonomuraea sp. NPDC050310 TaxID=3154935 RepID=UPI0033F10642
MDLPTYTNIWRIEKRLYKLYDLRLPMPLPIVWIGVFVGVVVPWSLLLYLVGVPFQAPWHVLYLVPPGVVTWLSTRPVIESKRLTELLQSQARYVGEPKVWCRLAPASEPETVFFTARVWRALPARAKTRKPARAAAPSKTRKPSRATAQPSSAAQPSRAVAPAVADVPATLTPHPSRRPANAPALTVPPHPSVRQAEPGRGREAEQPSRARETERGRARETERGRARGDAEPRSTRATEPARGGERTRATEPARGGDRTRATESSRATESTRSGQSSRPTEPSRATESTRGGEPAQVRARETEAGRRRAEPPRGARGRGAGGREVEPVETARHAEGAPSRPVEERGARRPFDRPLVRRLDEPPVDQPVGEPGTPAVPDQKTSAPTVGKPAAGDVAAGMPATTGAAAGISATTGAAAEKPATPGGAGGRPATAGAAAGGPTAGDKPSADKPTVDKPATDKPATDKPATDKPAAGRPVVGKPIDTEALRRLRKLAASAEADSPRHEAPRPAQPGPGQHVPIPPGDEVARTQHRKGQPPPRPLPSVAALDAHRMWPTSSDTPAEGTPTPASATTAQPASPADSGQSETPAPTSAVSAQPPASADLGHSETPAEAARAVARDHAEATAGPVSSAGSVEEAGVVGGRPAPEGAVDVTPVAGEATADSPATPERHGPVTPDHPSPVATERAEASAAERPEPTAPARPESASPEQPEPTVPTHLEQAAPARPEPVRSEGAEPTRPERPETARPEKLEGERTATVLPLGGRMADKAVAREPERPTFTPPPGPRRPAQSRPGQDRPGQDRPTQERPVQDRPTQDRPTQGRPVQDRPVQDRPVQGRPVQDRPAARAPERSPQQGVPTPRTGEGKVRRVESVVGRENSGGWRRIAQVVVGNTNVRGDGSEVDEARTRAVFSGSRRIVVLGCTGGAGQSTTALMLGQTLASVRDDRVLAIDASTGPTTLTSRIIEESPETLTSFLSGLDGISGYLTMRAFTTRTPSGLEVIAADSAAGAEQRLADRTLFSDHRLGQAVHLVDRHYKLTVMDPAPALAARVLPYADQLVLVVPANEDGADAVAMTYDWLDGHGCADLRRRAVLVVNGVSRRSMSDVEQAEAMARGRCRAIVRVPWEDELAAEGGEPIALEQLRTAGRRAYLALAGVVVAGFAAAQAAQQVSEAPSGRELAGDPPGTRIGER